MIYVALLFLLGFVLFFLREIGISIRRGFVASRGWTAHRANQPIQFWSGIAAWSVNAVAGAIFLILLLLSIGQEP